MATKSYELCDEMKEKLIEHEAKAIPQEKLIYAKLFQNREIGLASLPKHGENFVEVGTQTGFFAKEILQIVEPQFLHLIDIDYSQFDFEYFDKYIKSGRVIVHEGYSKDIMRQFPDNYFDYIYIDGDHSYPGVKTDLEISTLKIKKYGDIVLNDFTFYSPPELCFYGTPRAVTEILNSSEFYVNYLALHYWGYHDIAISRPKFL